MSKLNNASRLAAAALMIAGFALPHTALAQGKGDKGKHEGKEAKEARKHDDRDDDREGRIRSDAGTVVQPIAVNPRAKRIPPGLAKKGVTTSRAVGVTR